MKKIYYFFIILFNPLIRFLSGKVSRGEIKVCFSLWAAHIKISFFLFFLFIYQISYAQIPSKSQDHPVALVGGIIHTLSGTTIENGVILFDQGKIINIGINISLPDNTEKINVFGKHIYPGLIDANTTIGLVEIGAVRATVDINETGKINPNVRAEVAINPESEVIPVTRANGVTAALTIPGGGLISGTSALILLDGWTWEDMTLKSPAGMHVSWPRMTIIHSPWMRQTEEDQRQIREKEIKELTDAFKEARAYMKAKTAENEKDVPYHQVDLRWEALIPVFERKIPVFVKADEIQQIEAALAWSENENIKIVIVGGRDAWRCANLLKVKDIPVIVTPILTVPEREWEGYDTPFCLPDKLYKAGIKFCIAAEGAASNERNLPYHAAMASSYGLPKEEALKSVTLYPAQILGVADKMGSLEIGKDATLIITNGDPLEITTNVEREFIQGRDIDLNNRHKKLYEKYKEKYKRMGLIK